MDDLLKKNKDGVEDEVLDGVKRIADHVVKRDHKTDERFKEIDESIAKATEALDDKIEKIGNAAAERIERYAKRTSALSILGSSDPNQDLLEVLAPDEKALLPMYESFMAGGRVKTAPDPNSNYNDPIFRTAMGAFFLNALRSAPSIHGGRAMARCEKISRAFEAITKAAFDTTDVDVGGNFVPTAIENEIYRLITDNSVLRPLVTRIPMAAKTVELPKEGTNALTVTVGATEGGTIADSVPATAVTAVVSMTAEKYAGRAVASVESLQDSAISLMEWIQAKLAEEMGRNEDIQALEGTGSPHTGLLGDTDVNEIASVGVNGDPVTYAILVEMVYNAGERATRRGARWFVTPGLMADIVGLTDDQNLPVMRPGGTITAAIGPTLLGFPVEVHSGILQTRSKGSSSALSHAYFGDPRGLIFGDRAGMAWSVSEHAGFDNDEVHMKLTKRTGIAVGVPSAFTRRLELGDA